MPKSPILAYRFSCVWSSVGFVVLDLGLVDQSMLIGNERSFIISGSICFSMRHAAKVPLFSPREQYVKNIWIEGAL